MAEENAAKEAAPKPAESSGGKPILTYIMIFLVLVSAGAVGYTGFMVQKFVQMKNHGTKIDEVVAGEETAHKEDKEKEEKEFVGKTVPLETFLVNLSGSQGRRLLKVNMELELDGEKVLEEIEKRKPQIRDIIITLLSSKTYSQVTSKEGKEFLRDELRTNVNLFLTKGKIKQVLFTEFIYN